MKSPVLIISFTLLLISYKLDAQKSIINYEPADSLAMIVKYDRDIVKLSNNLTAPFTNDFLKARAIFRWITENIAYDFKFINKGREVKKPGCDNSINCSQKIEDWKRNYVKAVLQKKKAVCSGYAELFKTLCEYAGIKCEVVDGYARTKPYQVGNNMSVNHAWNAVLIDSNWYYLDATWAAGDCPESEETGKLLGFTKRYTEYYWLTPFNQLKRNHYPQNGKWAAEDNFTKQDFFNQPHYYPGDILENIKLLQPSSGVLEVKKGDTIHFEFEYGKEIVKLQVNSNVFRNPDFWYKEQVSKKKTKMVRDTSADRKQVYIPFIKDGNVYRFNYIAEHASLYYIDVIFNYKKSLRFRIKVKDQYN